MRSSLLKKLVTHVGIGAFGLALSGVSLASNPLFKDIFTADPAALVVGDKVYLYAGQDEAPDNTKFFVLNHWLGFSSTDLINWERHGPLLKATDFKWAKGDAWASQVIEKGGKYYWYVTVRHATINGYAIGVAVGDTPVGPFKDALGKALITNDMTTGTDIDWDDIDPSVFIDDDGQAYLFWGNTKPYYAKLKPNMIELDGPIHDIQGLPEFTEAIWVHKKKDHYYLSFAMGFPEKLGYAMSKSIKGPWEYKGILNEVAGNTPTNHQAIIEFKGRDYVFYHTGAGRPDGGQYRRSVALEELFYNDDGTIKRMIMTTEGVTTPAGAPKK